MALFDIAEDILHLILQFCDVYTVVSTTQVNKHFRAIALAKHLWIYLIEDLVARQLVDLPHDRSLQDYTTAELIEEVKKLVIGPRTWSRRSRTPPTILRHIKISPLRSDLPIGLELLPGGKYLAVIHNTHIELWSVVTCAVIWCRPIRWPWYTFELLEYADTVLCTFAAFETPESVKILSIDLSSGESTDVFEIDLPDGTRLADMPMLCDGFLLCALIDNELQRCLYLLVHWREDQAVALRSYFGDMKLLPGHIVFTGSDAPHSYHVHVYALVSFSGMWQPATSARLLEASIDLRDVPAVATQELPFSGIYRALIMLYKSPLHHDAYKLTIYRIVEESARPAPRRYSLKWMRNALFKRNSPPRGQEHIWTFHFTISKNILIDWVALSVPAFAAPYCSSFPSYAGMGGVHPSTLHLLWKDRIVVPISRRIATLSQSLGISATLSRIMFDRTKACFSPEPPRWLALAISVTFGWLVGGRMEGAPNRIPISAVSGFSSTSFVRALSTRGRL
ncbi:hypothetical protein C8J57DRAFT_1225526 [Mycena rebaudengoi]|nr:hypothetical protein C8J57DRAFT_1225526 [Mycena rebaudengoi]